MSRRRRASRWSALGVRLDLLRELGPRLAWELRRLNSSYAQASSSPASLYEEAMWREAAVKVGAEQRRLSPTIIEVRRGEATTHIAHRATTALTDRATFELSSDKPTSLQLLRAAGVPIPEHIVLESRDLAAAEAFMRSQGAPLIVKPAVGQGGSGVIGHVTTPAQLARALRHAARFDRRVLIERHMQGDSYRLLFLDGELLDTIRRPAPQLTGDGSSTIEELITREYERRIAAGGDGAGWKPYDIDLDCLTVVESSGYRLDSVLDNGTSIPIRTATNHTGPDLTETFRGTMSRDLVAASLAAVSVLGPRLAGVDVVTTDPERALEETGGVILEVNALPGLLHHYQVADQANATRVAVPILEALLGRPAPGLPYRPADR